MPALLTLEQAKQQVNVTSAVDDEEMQAYVDSATGIVEGKCGPVEPRTVVERVRGRGVVMLSTLPVLEIAGVQARGGVSVGIDGHDLDGGAGILTGLGPFVGSVTVTYVAGRDSVPPELNLAARIIFGHLWETQRRPSMRPGMGQNDAPPQPGLGYAIPNRALELMAPYRLAPEIA